MHIDRPETLRLLRQAEKIQAPAQLDKDRSLEKGFMFGWSTVETAGLIVMFGQQNRCHMNMDQSMT